jgi:hypothetical protein
MSSAGITELVREGSVSDLACDIPAGMTLAEYGAARRRPRTGLRGRRRLGRLRLVPVELDRLGR